MARARRRGAPVLRRRVGAAATESRNVLRHFLKTRSWWQTVLIIIGFVTVVMTFAVLILGLDDKPDQVTLTGEIVWGRLWGGGNSNVLGRPTVGSSPGPRTWSEGKSRSWGASESGSPEKSGAGPGRRPGR